MIGFYNYSVILTYIGLVSSVFGITQVFENHMSIAFLCLLLSGICDLFDGKIARSMKNRTEHEKVFGIQIDSLCDLVCFGVFPAVIGYHYNSVYPLSSYRKHYDSSWCCYQTWLLQRYGGRASEKHNREQKRI